MGEEHGGWGSEGFGEEGQWFDVAQDTRADHGHDHRLCPGAQPCAVAAPDLAIDHRRPDSLFAPIVRGGHVRMTQVREHLTQMVLEKTCQPPVAVVGETPVHDALQLGGEPARDHPQAVGRDFPFAEAIPGGQARLQQPLDCQGKPRRPTPGHFQQLFAALQEVRVALLVDRAEEPVVHAPAVVHQASAPIEPQQPFGHVAAAGGVDFVARGPRGCEGMQPSLASTDSPAGFVGSDFLRGPHVVADLLGGRRQTPRRPYAGAGRRRAVDLQPEDPPEHPGDLAVRKPQPFVEHAHQGVGLGAKLLARRARGRRGLQPMPAADRRATIAAMASMDPELPAHRPTDDLGLELLGRRLVFLQTRRATPRALRRQRGLVSLVDRSILRGNPAGVFPILSSSKFRDSLLSGICAVSGPPIPYPRKAR